jgi:hypothetical protein
MEDSMKGTAWRNTRVLTNDYHYVLQIDEIKGKREENRLLKDTPEWRPYGEGYDPVTKTKTIMFKRAFNTENEWKSWARSFPYELEEITEKTGRLKPYKLGAAYLASKKGK